MTSPLFPKFNERQQAALAAMRSRLGFLASQANEMAARGMPYRDRARTLSMLVRQAVLAGGGTRTEHYAQRRMRSLWDVMSVAGQGPLGDVVGALMRPSGRAIGTPEQELTALLNVAAELITSFGGEVRLPNWQEETQRQRASDREARNRADTLPPEFAYRGEQPRGRSESIVSVPDRDSRSSDNRGDDMIRVESSNVYAIGFRWNEQQPTKGTLLVRFWEKDSSGKKTGPGSTYAYYDVHPQVFEAFRLAASKGKFVWDRLRIRGTVTGHQFSYRLVGLGRSGYVPRQATRYGNREFFIKRTVTAAGGQSYRSTLPDRMVRQLSQRQMARIRQTGAPNRGSPNRGR